MNTRFLLFLAALASPAQALELDQPEIRFAQDCSVTLTFRLMPGAQTDPDQVWIEIASPPTYRKLQKAYPSWAGSARLEQIRHDGEDRLRIQSTEPIPTHSSTLILVLSGGHALPVFHTLNLPPCDASGVTREVAWGDTLLDIALEHARSLEVDAYTLMLAIQLYNRDAFIHDNINLMRAGARLYLPSQAEIARLSLPRQWLIDEVKFQNEQWQKWRRQRTDLRESRALQQRRLQLVPLEVRIEPEKPGSVAAEPAAAEPTELEPAETEPAQAEPAESGSPTAESAETEPAVTEALPDKMEVESEGFGQLADKADDDGTLMEMADTLPWPQVLTAVGALILAYLLVLGLRRMRQAREIQRSLGAITDPRQRATSALDLAHAHIEAKEYNRAIPLIRLVFADGTEEEREEAKKLKGRMNAS